MRRRWLGRRHASDPMPPQRSTEGVAQNDGFVSIGPGGNNINRRANGLLEVADVRPRVLRQFLQRAGTRGGFLPARQLYIDRLELLIALTGSHRMRSGLGAFII